MSEAQGQAGSTAAGLKDRVVGLETEFGLTATFGDPRGRTAEQVAGHLFRSVVAQAGSSNAFLGNGARLYLDVGYHPEYASAECNRLEDLLAQDRAGEGLLADLAREATQRLRQEGSPSTVYLLKNNVDSAGNTFGCHENYLVPRSADLQRLSERLVPLLITRQLLCGAGRLRVEGGKARFDLTQRAEHIFEGVSSATTRTRPIINTRDEPHADATRFRRLHVIVGDSSMLEPTALLKVVSVRLLLDALEDQAPVPDVRLADPMAAIRVVSTDATGTAPLALTDGSTTTALQLQREYLAAAQRQAGPGPARDHLVGEALDLWGRALDAIESGDLAPVERELDWVAKRAFLTAYARKHELAPTDPRLAQLDLAWHDIDPARGVARLLESRGLLRRITTDEEASRAREVPPQDTRARLRGMFLDAARRHHRDFNVDWVHLRLNDGSMRTVLCHDPLRSHDERVDRVVAQMETEDPAVI